MWCVKKLHGVREGTAECVGLEAASPARVKFADNCHHCMHGTEFQVLKGALCEMFWVWMGMISFFSTLNLNDR